MGFNIQQYEMYDNDTYSNAVGYLCEAIPFKKRREECEKARDARKSTNPENVSADTALSKGAVCVKGIPIYINAPIYALTSRNQRTQNRLICKARKDAKIKDDVAPVDAVKDNPATDLTNPNVAPSSGAPDATKSNIGLYIGIGVGVLAIGIVSIILIRRK